MDHSRLKRDHFEITHTEMILGQEYRPIHELPEDLYEPTDASKQIRK